MPVSPGRSILALAAFSLGCAVSEGVWGQALYRWVDPHGKTHYSDKPPVGFRGEVTRIETDAVATPAPRAPGKATAKVETDDDEKAPGIGERRRALRELLAARLAAARTRLEDARKALADGEDPREGDKQIVQQHHVRDGRRPGRTPAPRSNCMSQKTSDGRPIWNCPTPIPGEAHFARQKGLEDAVRIAEDEVSEAERAYRRGVD